MAALAWYFTFRYEGGRKIPTLSFIENREE
jgi:hypothetical protein